ncbi:hypothetical protein [Paraliomyxa miuraensis]|uniref:hypothetical protein n=1 Tax=Paraliomyxa miuraensis TaxID=376150 RepID=UPI002255D145|nr:hypothetical protein [Paraliomyxa miuraensis]
MLASLLFASLGCTSDDESCWHEQRIVEPRLGLARSFAPDDDPDDPDACAFEPTCEDLALRPGDAFVVIHRLPPQLDEIPYSLELTVTTPCHTVEIEATHHDGLVVLPRTAPQCAEQGLVVTAEIANSRLQCVQPALTSETSSQGGDGGSGG